MTDTEIDIKEIKATLKAMQRDIDYLKNMQPIPQPFPSVTAASPECYASVSGSCPVHTETWSLSEARSLWPTLENEFDRYCAVHEITVWTPDDNTRFYNECVRCRCRLAEQYT